MKLFNQSRQTKSVSDFKKSAANIDKDDAINAITGGTLSGCHPIRGASLSSLTTFDAITSINTLSVQF